MSLLVAFLVLVQAGQSKPKPWKTTVLPEGFTVQSPVTLKPKRGDSDGKLPSDTSAWLATDGGMAFVVGISKLTGASGMPLDEILANIAA